MQLTNTPGKLVLPFANAGAKNTIPTASQIGITAGAASLTDGFPPLTRTPIAAGGVPPSGLDMNGILYELSAILRWANAGGGYAYDSTFANDSNVNGYPKGARIMRSDGLGYWFNTVENNTTDPEAAGAAAAGWVPDFTNGVTSVAMASANVTLTPLQYGKPIIVITGTLTANLNLIFPTIVNEWTVINNTTGPYTITCKTAAGTGLVVNTAALIVGDGANIQSAVTDAAALFGETVATATGGTADAITATFAPVPRYASNGVPLRVRATAANATTTPTFTPASGTIAAKQIVKGAGSALAAGDIAGEGHWIELQYDLTLDKWVLLNPATGVSLPLAVVGTVRNAKMVVAAASATSTFTADEVVVESALGGAAYKIANFNKAINLATTGAGGMDTGVAPASGYIAIYAIYNPTTKVSALLATNATSVAAPNIYGGANMPAGYTASALLSVWPTNASSQFVIGVQNDRRISLASVTVLNTTSTTAGASLSISGAVPLNAKRVSGQFGCGATGSASYIYMTVSPVSNYGAQLFQGNTNLGNVVGCPFNGLELTTPQQIYYAISSGSGISATISVNGYEI